MQIRVTKEMSHVAELVAGALEVAGPRLLCQLQDRVDSLRLEVVQLRELRDVEQLGEGTLTSSLLLSEEREGVQQVEGHIKERVAAFAAMGGIVGAWATHTVLLYAASSEASNTDAGQVFGSFCGSILASGVAFCLPRNAALAWPWRVFLEAMVVAGWAGAVASQIVLAYFYDSYLAPNSFLPAFCSFAALLFFISPLSFAALCCNNIDRSTIRLLARQTQFWTVQLMVLALVVVALWGSPAWFWYLHRPLSVISTNLLRYSPYVVILFMDALRTQSVSFRLTLPILYVAYVIATIIQYGFSAFDLDTHPTTLINISGSSFTHGQPVVIDDLSSIVQINCTILFLSSGYLYAAIRGSGRGCIGLSADEDCGGGLVFFPIRVRLQRADVAAVTISAGCLTIPDSVMVDVRALVSTVRSLQGEIADESQRGNSAGQPHSRLFSSGVMPDSSSSQADCEDIYRGPADDEDDEHHHPDVSLSHDEEVIESDDGEIVLNIRKAADTTVGV